MNVQEASNGLKAVGPKEQMLLIGSCLFDQQSWGTKGAFGNCLVRVILEYLLDFGVSSQMNHVLDIASNDRGQGGLNNLTFADVVPMHKVLVLSNKGRA